MWCHSGKKQYPNGAEAARENRKLKRQIKGFTEMRPYRCPDCHQYHLGNQKWSKMRSTDNRAAIARKTWGKHA